ncbi:MAG TPA: UDP-N-acetylglucosamine--N-acetylmuramyl-(pentapeptide) pyrophosphoryl-undecaprenol N-acetylglucosamine transferase [Pirellulales bacterium]|jgi:UDP-N-acetylglucosamine--N-acetylmuramyl-(pentapeptide) pyrophosphoryl-undecaprenol N-acetylglucosamine transferase|nr:UDP-N-acetylglucosamine--N-acetylmuramyl-(pentapeptide) pyrophosphoryl-undecaprenol N-acetylglucosamine transferase [Pirellulales bacterium]
MPSTPSIVFTGGGTGGHLFAGLAAAEAFRELEPDATILFAGRGLPWERREVGLAGYEYASVPCCPWPGSASTGRTWRVGRFVAMNSAGFLSGRRLLRRHGASVVVALGGYSSAPVGRAAVSLRVPLVLLEQNALPGRVTRWLSRKAACVCASFEPQADLAAGNVQHTGNPIRRGFLWQDRKAGDRERLLVVTGGSLGAGPLNSVVPAALAKVKPLVAGWRIVHQTGERDLAATRDRYRELDVAAEVVAFADLASLFPRAGLAISRAGGSTLSELALCGVPTIVCPYPQASKDHQRKNAAALGDACRVVEQELPDLAGRLAAELTTLLTDAELRRSLSRRMLLRARPDAAARVARTIQRVAIPVGTGTD